MSIKEQLLGSVANLSTYYRNIYYGDLIRKIENHDFDRDVFFPQTIFDDLTVKNIREKYFTAKNDEERSHIQFVISQVTFAIKLLGGAE